MWLPSTPLWSARIADQSGEEANICQNYGGEPPAHRDEALRTFLTTPDLKLQLVPLPPYGPDRDADEAVWDWAQEEITRNTCLEAEVHGQVKAFLSESQRACGQGQVAVSHCPAGPS